MRGWVFATNVRTAFADPSAAGNTPLIPQPPAGSKIRVIAYRLQTGFSGPLSMKFTDTDGNPLSQTWDFNAREGCIVSSLPGSFEFQTPMDKGVQINLSGPLQAHVSVQYVEVDGDF
jgi:hypothetical protein